MLEELLCFRFTPCLALHESESIGKSRESKSPAEVLLSFPHVLRQRCIAWINNPTEEELHHLRTVVNVKKNGKHFYSRNYQHYHLSSHLFLLQHLTVRTAGTSLPLFLASREQLCNSAAAICSSSSEPSREALELLQSAIQRTSWRGWAATQHIPSTDIYLGNYSIPILGFP